MGKKQTKNANKKSKSQKKHDKKSLILIFTILLLFGVMTYEGKSIKELVEKKKSNSIQTSASVDKNVENKEANNKTNKSVKNNAVKNGEIANNKNEVNNTLNENNDIEEVEEEEEIVREPSPYYIKVNRTANVATVYERDSNGEYTIPVKAMVCTTGYATPYGVYQVQGRWNWGGLMGDVYGQYCMHIVGDIMFHSVPYLEQGNKASIEWWEYDKLRNNCLYGMC